MTCRRNWLRAGGVQIANSSSGWYLSPAERKTIVYQVTAQGLPERIAFTIAPGRSSPPPERDRFHLVAELTGLAAPLSVAATYRQVYREVCSQCQKFRRVDDERCEHCAADWDLPPSESIEITDREPENQSNYFRRFDLTVGSAYDDNPG